MFKAKYNLIPIVNNGLKQYLIRKDNIYKGEYTPKIYHPKTPQRVMLAHLIITCEDGMSRKFDINNFYLLEEWREIQLANILD